MDPGTRTPDHTTTGKQPPRASPIPDDKPNGTTSKKPNIQVCSSGDGSGMGKMTDSFRKVAFSPNPLPSSSIQQSARVSDRTLIPPEMAPGKSGPIEPNPLPPPTPQLSSSKTAQHDPIVKKLASLISGSHHLENIISFTKHDIRPAGLDAKVQNMTKVMTPSWASPLTVNRIGEALDIWMRSSYLAMEEHYTTRIDNLLANWEASVHTSPSQYWIEAGLLAESKLESGLEPHVMSSLGSKLQEVLIAREQLPPEQADTTTSTTPSQGTPESKLASPLPMSPETPPDVTPRDQVRTGNKTDLTTKPKSTQLVSNPMDTNIPTNPLTLIGPEERQSPLKQVLPIPLSPHITVIKGPIEIPGDQVQTKTQTPNTPETSLLGSATPEPLQPEPNLMTRNSPTESRTMTYSENITPLTVEVPSIPPSPTITANGTPDDVIISNQVQAGTQTPVRLETPLTVPVTPEPRQQQPQPFDMTSPSDSLILASLGEGEALSPTRNIPSIPLSPIENAKRPLFQDPSPSSQTGDSETDDMTLETLLNPLLARSSLVLRTIHYKQRNQKHLWSIEPVRPTLFIGDCNLIWLPLVWDFRVQVDSYPSARLSHIRDIVNKLPRVYPYTRHIILHVGTFDRHNLTGELLENTVDRLNTAVCTKFPNAKVFYSPLLISPKLPTLEQNNMRAINACLAKYRTIPALAPENVHMQRDNIHWQPGTGIKIYGSWQAQLD